MTTTILAELGQLDFDAENSVPGLVFMAGMLDLPSHTLRHLRRTLAKAHHPDIHEEAKRASATRRMCHINIAIDQLLESHTP